MVQIKKCILVLVMLLSVSCNAVTQSVPQTQVPVPVSTQAPPLATLPPATATVAPTATETPTQTPTDTPVPVAVTATLDPASATLQAEMGSMGTLSNIRQYFNPVGTPVQNWNSIPIMPEATAGQEFNSNIYSYKATARLAQALAFYTGKAKSLGVNNPPETGSAGSGDQATHMVTFISYNLTIVISSFDNDTGHVIVVISRFQ
jgi:hypothetical protein